MKKPQASSLKPILGVLAVLLIVVACGGCEKQTPPPPPPSKAAPPPEPSAEQIAGEIRPVLSGFWMPGAGTIMAQGLRDARTKNEAKQNGPAALAQIGRELTDSINEARAQGRWKIVLAGIEAYEALEPGTTTFARIKEMALLQASKPKVKIKGFFTDKARDNETYVWMEVTDPATQEPHIVKVREGEEFDGLKLVKIIGLQQGVTLEYLKIPGDFFDVKKQQ